MIATVVTTDGKRFQFNNVRDHEKTQLVMCISNGNGIVLEDEYMGVMAFGPGSIARLHLGGDKK